MKQTWAIIEIWGVLRSILTEQFSESEAQRRFENPICCILMSRVVKRLYGRDDVLFPKK